MNGSDWQDTDDGGRELVCISTWEFCIPDGYDGPVVGFCDSRIDWPNNTYIYDVYDENSFLLFRLK